LGRKRKISLPEEELVLALRHLEKTANHPDCKLYATKMLIIVKNKNMEYGVVTNNVLSTSLI
jgi:hypothetical protein